MNIKTFVRFSLAAASCASLGLAANFATTAQSAKALEVTKAVNTKTVTIQPGKTVTMAATCPAGYLSTGGGFRGETGNPATNKIVVIRAYKSSPVKWAVTWHHRGSTATQYELFAIAFCAK